MKYVLQVLFLIVMSHFTYSQDQIKLPILEIDYEIGSVHGKKIIDTYQKAIKVGLDQDLKREKSFFNENILYLFEVGGGCFGASKDEITVNLVENVATINWSEPKEECPEIGEAMAFYGVVVISKKKHPNHEKMKFKYYWEE